MARRQWLLCEASEEEEGRGTVGMRHGKRALGKAQWDRRCSGTRGPTTVRTARRAQEVPLVNSAPILSAIKQARVLVPSKGTGR